jgi:hypothetical protein
MKKMKKILCFLTALILLSNVNAQNTATFFTGIDYGYGKTAYSMKEYKSASFSTIGAHVAGGIAGLQLGGNFWTDLSGASFTIQDSLGNNLRKEKINDTYIGLTLSGFAHGDNTGQMIFIFGAGIGSYSSKKDVDGTTTKFKSSTGYNGRFGFTIPLTRSRRVMRSTTDNNIHLTIEGIFNYNPRKYDNVSYYYSTWSVRAGISYVLFYN